MNKDQVQELIRKYLENRCSKEEFEQALGLLSDESVSVDVDKVLAEFWDKAATSETEGGDTQALELLALAKTREVQNIRPLKQFIGWPLRIAAAIILFISGLFYIQYISGPADQNALTELSSSYGEIKVEQLPDGSTVHLNAGSKITFTRHFAGNSRSVKLEGQAFFDVKENPAKEFIISTADLEVWVIGTSFGVKSYQKSNRVYVTVSSGKVQVSKRGKAESETYQLLKGDQLIYNKIAGKFSQQKVDAAKYSSWRRGILYFNNTAISEIIKQLERSYRVRIELEDKTIGRLTVSGEHANENLQNVLESLSFTHNLKVEYRDSTDIRISRN